MRVGRVAEGHGAAAEHLRLRGQLYVDFEPDHHFVLVREGFSQHGRVFSVSTGVAGAADEQGVSVAAERGWRARAALYLGRRVVAIVFLGFSGGLPLGKRAPQRQANRLQELKRWSEYLDIPLTVN